VSHHFDYVVLPAREGNAGAAEAGAGPVHLSFDPASDAQFDYAVSQGLTRPPAEEITERVLREAYESGALPRLSELRVRRDAEITRVAKQVNDRLTAESNRWYGQAMRLSGAGDADGGDETEPAKSPAAARRKAEELVRRRDRRLAELEARRHLVAEPGIIRGIALVLPPDAAGEALRAEKDPDTFAISTEESERRGVSLTLAVERALGRTPEEMPHNNKGFDIRSTDEQGNTYFIEVKARTRGAETFTVTANEITFAQSQGDRHILSLVSLSPAGPSDDDIRYEADAFDSYRPGQGTQSSNERWAYHWERGRDPRAGVTL